MFSEGHKRGSATSMQDDLIQQTHEAIAGDRARFVILDDQLKELGVPHDQIT